MTEVTAAERAVMEELIDTALDRQGSGGPAAIAAAIMRGDTLLARGANEVHLNHDPSRHAEIVAISAACRALGTADLSGCTLVTTLQPCEMCLGAIRFAGIGRVVFAAQKGGVQEAKYFGFPGLDLPDFVAACDGELTTFGGVGENRILHVYAEGND
ncbi:nucleoside deaminase [Sagittula sp.]|uniref:nucleoside deaminase n=1 Tax=Sagittula sp. TaxID=2038081 RepID=UPI0035139DC5